MANYELDRLKDLFSYDPKTGEFTYLHNTRGHRAGAIAGTVLNNGYVQLRIDGKKDLAHRIAWFMVYGEMPEVIDHINGIRDDNRIANLRLSTCRENQQNRIEHREYGCLPGVHFTESMRTNPWRSTIGVKGKRVHLGYFPTKQEAYEAYMKACEAV